MSGPSSVSEKKNKVSVNQLELGKTFYHDVSAENNCINAFKFISRSAKLGNAEAQFMLGNLYALGHGTETDHEKAYMWYTKSAIQGYKKALIRIHNLYQEDVGVHCRGQLNSEEDEWNTEEFKQANKIRELNEYRLERMKHLLNGAIDYYTNQFKILRSAKQDDPEAQQTLGFLYQHGYGVKKITRWAIECYTAAAAEQGFIDAQYNLGYLYQKNTSMKFNYRKAFQWYEMAAQGGNIAAQIRLAYFYEKGLVGDIDWQRALFWYTNAANSGNSEAQLALGRIYRQKNEVYKNNSGAIKWYSMAAQQGNHVARHCLFHLNKSGTPSDLENNDNVSQYSSSVSIKERLCSRLHMDIERINAHPHIARLKKLAQRALVGDGNAMYEIGLQYYKGIDLSEDKDIALRWIKKSAKAGFKEAQLMLAKMYEKGDVVEQNYHKTSIWIKSGAKTKDSRFQCNLGILYKKGLGVRHDYLESSKWFTISADRGNKIAQYELGLLLYFGNGVGENRAKAFSCFNDSARQRYVDALYRLGKIHISSEIEEDKTNLAMKMFRYAAKNGNTEAQLELGKIYQDGDNIQQDLSKAKTYYKMIIDSGTGGGQYEMALKYLKGEFFPRDYGKSFQLFKTAAEKGFSKARHLLNFPMLKSKGDLEDSSIIEMFESVSNSNIESKEFNIGFYYEINQQYSIAHNWYLKAIDKNDARALYRLGIFYEDGKGVLSDFKQAFGFYEKAYNKEEIGSIYRLGCMYLDGRGVEQDLNKAFQLYTEASNMKHNESRKILLLSESNTISNVLILNYGQEEPIKINEIYQINMLESVATLGSVAVQYRLSLFYQRNGDPRAAKWLIHLATSGMSDAYYRLGTLHEEGRVVKQSHRIAADMYQKAIKGNDERAMYNLGKLYYYGKGVHLDFSKAYALFIQASKLGHHSPDNFLDITRNTIMQCNERGRSNKSGKIDRLLRMCEFVAEENHVDLQYKLGAFYENNEAYQDYSKSFRWYKKAFESGHRDATYHLGQLYKKGLGVEKNDSQSVHFYERAKDLGSNDALFELGSAYHHGHGVSKNTVKAKEYYVEAATNGQAESQYTLGELYIKGDLLKKDLLEAIKWFTRASIQGHECSTTKLYEMYTYETYFYKKLFQILSKFGMSEKKQDRRCFDLYGSMLYKLANLYQGGHGTQKSIEEALKYFSESYYIYNFAESKKFTSLEQDIAIESSVFTSNLESYWKIRTCLNNVHQYHLGIYYYEEASRIRKEGDESKAGISTSNNSVEIQRSITYLTLSANNKHKMAQLKLIDIYQDGQLITKEPSKVVDLHRNFARLATKEENYDRGMNYYNGNEVEQDYAVSLIYLEAAANKKYSYAKIQLGDMYRQGVGVSSNYKAALKYYDSSTENLQGYKCYCQGKIYSTLEDVKQRNELSLLYFQAASKKGDSGAQLELGHMYLKGEGVEPNYDKALEEYKNSTNEMTGEDCYAHGERFFEGKGVKKDYQISQMFFEKAAAKNNPYGDCKLGEIFFKGLGLDECDYNKSYEHYRKAAEEGITKAQSQLAYMYLKGRGAKKSFEAALIWYKASTRGMTADECFREGKMFFKSEDLERNYEISYNYIKASAKKGHSEAALMLGDMHLEGKGTEKNPNKAFEWYENFAKTIPVEECIRLGTEYYIDNKVEKHRELSFIFFKEAARKGDCDAQIKVGDMYLQGYGTALDHDMALKCYELSTEKMDGARCYSLGENHFTEDSRLSINQKISFVYFKAAYEKGSNEVHARLGYMYLKGLGVDANRQESAKHYRKALENGDRSAQTKINFLYSVGVGMGPKDKEIERYHQNKAQGMNAATLYEKGNKFYTGNGVALNHELARFYFTEAANRNYHDAYAKLGEIYSKGYGIQANIDTARHWFTLSAKEMTPEKCLIQAKSYGSPRNKKADQVASFSYYKEAADKGIVEAQTELGEMYLEGRGIEKNDQLAFKYYRKSARNMLPTESYGYRKTFLDQLNSSTDIKKKIGLIYLEESAEAGFYKAQAELGDIYLRGRDVEQNTEKAISLYERCAPKMGSDESYSRGEKTYDGFDDDVGYKISLIFLKSAASMGNDKAHTIIGERYFSGKGVNKKAEKAFYHFHIAAENGHSEAQARLGDMYLQGTGVTKNYPKAKEWYKNSTEKMPSYDCFLRGKNFFDGKDVIQDYDIARIFFESAVEKGNIKALTMIGYMYFNGLSFPQSYEESFTKYQNAANNGDVEAQIKLANMYTQGLGIPVNINAALKWCESSVNVMSANECYNQAIIFLNDAKSTDPKRNKTVELALFYVMSAAEKGNKDAQETINSLFKQHTKSNPLDNLPNELHDIATIEMNGYDCYIQGINFFEGNGVSVNHQVSFIYFRKAAEKGYHMAYIKLGDMYLNGFGINSNLKEALKWYKISTLEMSGADCYAWGDKFYTKGNIEVSFVYFKEAAKKGYIKSYTKVADMYLEGEGVNISEEDALSYYMKAAETGDINAKAKVQSIEEQFLKDESDRRENSRADDQAAERNTPHDLYLEGKRYLHETDIDSHYIKAHNYFLRAGQAGHSVAYVELGDMYLEGLGIEKNYKKASKMYETSVKNMDGDICYQNGERFFNGTSETVVDYQISLIFFKKAAENGNTNAHVKLGEMYYKGLGVVRNVVISFEHYKVAAENGNKEAQRILGSMYHQGTGVGKDIDKALHWYALGSSFPS